jgi:phosphate uptake regulator
MERRKISTLGKYSLIVTLPKDWTRMNKIQGGDEVSLKIQGDGSLVIHPEFDFKEKQNEVVLPIKVNEDIKMIQRKIIGCYLNGYDTIVLKSGKNFSREQQEGIRSIVKSLYMRIYESHANQVTLQAFMDESLASVTSGIERMHIITSSMAKDVIISLRDWDVDLANSVISLEEDVDQFMFFLTRLLRTAVNNPSLASKLQISMSDCIDYHLLVNRIEYVADCLTNIATSVIMLHEHQSLISGTVLQSLINASTTSLKYFDLAVDAFFSDSLEDTGEIIDYADQFTFLDNTLEVLPFSGETDKQIVILCYSILENILHICNHTADIAEIVIDRHYNPT